MFGCIAGAAFALILCAFLSLIALRVNAAQTSNTAPPLSKDEGSPRVQTAQNAQAPSEGGRIEDERKRLRGELARIRGKQLDDASEKAPRIPPLPVRRPPPVLEAAAESTSSPKPSQALSGAELNKTLSQLLIFDFIGTEASDSGVKAVTTLVQQGAIAGVLIGKQNTTSRNQLRDLIKTITQGKGKQVIVAIREMGGLNDALTYENGFEPWPSQNEIIAKGDPEYAYSTYRTLAANLEFLGITLNIGPKIGAADADTYGKDPLRNAVFTKTFILGHRESHILPVPIVDQSDVSFKTLKSILVSDAAISIAATSESGGVWPALFNSPLISGARFCVVDYKSGQEAENAPADIKQGCDMLVVSHAGDPQAVRQRVGAAIANAIAKGDLSTDRLAAAAGRAQALRSQTLPDSR